MARLDWACGVFSLCSLKHVSDVLLTSCYIGDRVEFIVMASLCVCPTTFSSGDVVAWLQRFDLCASAKRGRQKSGRRFLPPFWRAEHWLTSNRCPTMTTRISPNQDDTHGHLPSTSTSSYGVTPGLRASCWLIHSPPKVVQVSNIGAHRKDVIRWHDGRRNHGRIDFHAARHSSPI